MEWYKPFEQSKHSPFVPYKEWCTWKEKCALWSEEPNYWGIILLEWLLLWDGGVLMNNGLSQNFSAETFQTIQWNNWFFTPETPKYGME